MKVLELETVLPARDTGKCPVRWGKGRDLGCPAEELARVRDQLDGEQYISAGELALRGRGSTQRRVWSSLQPYRQHWLTR